MAQQQVYGKYFINDFPAESGVPLPPVGQARLYYNGTNLVCFDSNGNQLIGTGAGGVTSVAGTANQITVTGTTAVTLSIPSIFTFPGTVTNNLSIFGATTSAQFAALCSDETGSGALVFAVAPTFPSTITVGANGGTAGQLILNGSTSGSATITAPAIAGTATNGVTSSNVFLVPDGAAATPGFGFSAQPGTGMYRNAARFCFTSNTNDSMAIVFSGNPFIYTTSTGVFAWSSTGLTGSADTGLSRTAATVVRFGNGTANDVSGFYQWGGQKRTTTQTDFSANTTLANLSGLTVNVAAGRTYTFEAVIHGTVAGTGTGGLQVAIAGTATATAIIYVGQSFNALSGVVVAAGRSTTLGSSVAGLGTTTATGLIIWIKGTITVNAAGTLTVQAAQSSSNATNSSVLVGSTFTVYDCP